jgi:hypothetical protein
MAPQSLPSCPPVAHGQLAVEDEEEQGKATMLVREEDAVGRARVDFTQRRGRALCVGEVKWNTWQ